MNKLFLRKAVKFAYNEWIYPNAKKYVESTENDYDNQALAFLDSLVDRLIGDLLSA